MTFFWFMLALVGFFMFALGLTQLIPPGRYAVGSFGVAAGVYVMVKACKQLEAEELSHRG